VLIGTGPHNAGVALTDW